MDLAGWLIDQGDALAVIPGELTAAVAAFLATIGGVALLAWRLSPALRPGVRGLDLTDGSVFLFYGRELRAASDDAAALLRALPAGGEPMDRLSAWVEGSVPDFDARLARLVLTGESFSCGLAGEDGRMFELRVEPRGALTALVFRESSALQKRLRSAEARLTVLEDEGCRLRRLLDAAPVLLWERDGSGEILLQNAAYAQEVAAVRGVESALPNFLFAGPTDSLPVTRSGEGGRRRLSLQPVAGERRWFEVAEDLGPDGRLTGYALDAGPIVRAEAALKRFVETLTETFAHLPTGLAVFDKNRRLGLFNPAISEILKLDPAWLASRPTLRDFLERLRENRQMPDQKDFLAWRRKLTALERDAEAAAYEETWVLPSGQTLQVIGRPHPQGAIAFLFEDISAAVMLERRYRSEIEMQRSVLNKFPEAISLFSPDGTLAFANTAFQGVWGFDPEGGDRGPHISRLIERWSAVAEPTGVWRELRDFVTAQEARSAWTVRLGLRDGRILRGRFAPLPNGSTLASFGDETERERVQAGLCDRIATLELGAAQAETARISLLDDIDRGLVHLAALAEDIAGAQTTGGQADTPQTAGPVPTPLPGLETAPPRSRQARMRGDDDEGLLQDESASLRRDEREALRGDESASTDRDHGAPLHRHYGAPLRQTDGAPPRVDSGAPLREHNEGPLREHNEGPLRGGAAGEARWPVPTLAFNASPADGAGGGAGAGDSVRDGSRAGAGGGATPRAWRDRIVDHVADLRLVLDRLAPLRSADAPIAGAEGEGELAQVLATVLAPIAAATAARGLVWSGPAPAPVRTDTLRSGIPEVRLRRLLFAWLTDAGTMAADGARIQVEAVQTDSHLRLGARFAARPGEMAGVSALLGRIAALDGGAVLLEREGDAAQDGAEAQPLLVLSCILPLAGAVEATPLPALTA